MYKPLTITGNSGISAIYYALLGRGYEFIHYEKDATLVAALEAFAQPLTGDADRFFADVRQGTCQAYPYWPRAAALEKATYFMNERRDAFAEPVRLRDDIMSADNITDAERNADFWQWIEHFPHVLQTILSSAGFHAYLEWEAHWLTQQNRVHCQALATTSRALADCLDRYGSAAPEISIILNPIKCAYASDYYLRGQHLYFCSGSLRPQSIVHEYLHPIVHPIVQSMAADILTRRRHYPTLDNSYSLDGSAAGQLNAFEEHLVRHLTGLALTEQLPDSLPGFAATLLAP